MLIGIADGEETDYDIVAASSNSFKVCGRAPLPDEFGKTPKYGPFKLRCLPDGANNRVVAARGSEATLIPLKRLSVPDEPFLLLHLKTPQSASLGTRLAIPFKPHDPACKVALAAAPKGVRLVGNSVVWTPTESQVGRANVALRLSHKGFERVQNVSFDVVRRHVKIGFVPDAFRVSPSGRTVVAWTGGARDRWRGRDDEQPAKCRVAVIDTEQGKVVASKLLLNPISAAAVDDHYVYVAPAHADRISALSLKDLSEAKKSHTKGRVIGFTCVSSKLLFAATEEHVLTYSVPDLKPVDLPAYPTAKEEGSDRSDAERVLRYAKRPYARRPLRVMRYDEGEPEMPERLPAGFYAGGCVFDPDFAKARMLVDVRGFPALEVERVNPAKPPAAWDRSVGDGGQILTSQGRRVGRWEQSSVIISRDYPIGVALSAVRGDGDDYERVSVDLSLFDLVSAKLVKKIPLIKRSEADGRFDGFGDVVRGGALHLAGRKVIVLLRDRLFTYTIDEEPLRKLPAPFGFEPPREVATVSAKGKSRIEHKLRGGQKPFQFDLTTSRKGIEIDKRSGTVTIDGPLLLKDAMAQIGQAVGERLRDAARDDEATVPAAKIVAGFANPLKARFKKLVGRDPGGIPVLVPIGLAASDKSQRVASLDYQVVLEVPEGVVVKAMEIIVRAIEQRRKEIATERAERERRWRERAKPTPVPVPKKPDDDRVEKLEKRITALEAKLDLLMKLLEPLRSREKEK